MAQRCCYKLAVQNVTMEINLKNKYMTCPNCKKYSYCGCKSCHKRKGLSSVRTSKMSGENIKCPYCRETFSIDYVETENYLRDFEYFEDDANDILTEDNTDGTENPLDEQW